MTPVTYDNTCKTTQNHGTGTVLLAAEKENRRETAGKTKNLDKTIHDFRSSLNIIMGYSELMLDGVLGKMTQEQCEGLKDILTCSQDMLGLINDVAIWQGKSPGSK